MDMRRCYEGAVKEDSGIICCPAFKKWPTIGPTGQYFYQTKKPETQYQTVFQAFDQAVEGGFPSEILLGGGSIHSMPGASRLPF